MFDTLSRAQKLIVLAHVILALLYGAVIPPWEAHDETGHFAYINHIVAQRELPRVEANSNVFLDQSHQPPLYYLIASALTFWVDRSDDLQPHINTFAFDGSNRRGARIVLRTPSESFPWRGTVLALHAARIVSALLSGLMLLFIAKTAALLFADSPSTAALATAIAAFNPQALFMAGMVNNDVLISVIGAALLFEFASWVMGHSSWVIRHSLLIGLLLGLGLLAKRSAYGLIGFAMVALLYFAWRQRWRLAQTTGRIALTLGTTLLVASPYFIRNLLLYGQLIADRKNDSPFLQPSANTTAAGVAVALRDGWLPQIFINGFRTFWGTFGWGNLQLPDWAYATFLAFTVVGIAGYIVAAARPGSAREILIGLAVFFLSMVLLPLVQAIFYQNPQLFVGRYLMPALGAFACMLAVGWMKLGIGRAIKPGFAPLKAFEKPGLIALATFALITPFAFITPAYTTPVSRNEQPALLTFEDIAQVTNVEAKQVYVQDKEGQRPYAEVQVTWRALRRTDEAHENFVFGISVLGYNNEVLGQTSVYPGLGNYPSTNWNAGDVFTDRYFVQIEKPCAVLPTQARISLGVFTMALAPGQLNTAREIIVTRTLKPLDGEGRQTAPILGAFRIEQTPPVWKFWQDPIGKMKPDDKQEGIWLRQRELPVQVAPGSTFTVRLAYEPAQADNPPATAFVHLLDANGQRVAQQDQPPQSGFYPTNLWLPGECVREAFTLTVPLTATGTLRAVTGFYAADGIRFTTPFTDDNDVIELGLIEVKP